MTNSFTLTSLLAEQLRQQPIAPTEWLPLLARYQLVPNLLSESIIAQAIDPILCTPEETEQVCTALYQQWGLETEAQQSAWHSHYNLTLDQLQPIATRNLRLKKFIETTWGHRLESYFLQHKHKLDQVIYSLIRHRDRDLVNELYFRIVEGEQTFAELAQTYSEGAEAQTGGVLGPFEFGSLNPDLAKLLYYVPAGEVVASEQIGNCYAIVRVEQRLPAQLDDAMRHRLLQQQFNQWFQTQVRQLSEWDQRWMGVTPQSTEQSTEAIDLVAQAA
ncbi:MAG TPA: peptidylprolyl isomerase [Trichocoleus sp.]|jgi:parvulin-like peptidyl-prolyl isomerase